jgi:hypothetical protein
MDIIALQTDGPEAPEPEIGGPAPGHLIAGEYRTRTWNHHTGEDGRLFCGVWESTPGIVRIDYEEWEYCHLTAGSVVLTRDDGRQWHFRAGDGFMIPAGFKGTWETVLAVRKEYVILLPA